jgi:threonine dehydrogenase-like Zn-dependent dehydrogenase
MHSSREMRAALLAKPRKTLLVKTEIPKPGPGNVRVRLEGCGLCSSILPAWEGRSWFRYPFEAGEPGHEGWGVIDEVGSSIDKNRIGERVAVVSYNALAEYDIAPADAVVPMPTPLMDLPFPGEALGCAMNVFGRSDIQAQQTVAIVGIGFLGALLCKLASYSGANVIAITRRPYALAIAQQSGAAHTITLGDRWETTAQTIINITDGRGCDRVIEAVGIQETLDLASEVVCPRGRLIIAAYHQDGLRRVNMQQWNWRGIDVINAHERDIHTYAQGMRTAIEAIANGIINPVGLYTHRFALDEIDEAVQTMRERPDGFMKALVIT